MSDNPFDRRIINPREKPVSEDINALQSQLDRTLRFFAKSLFSTTAGAPQPGFFGGGFSTVESGPQGMSVVLKAGLGFQDDQTDVPGDINGITSLDDFESYKPLPLLGDLTIPIPTAPAGPNSRIDIIEVRADRLVTDNQGRDVFNVTTEEFQSDLVDKTMEFLLDGTKTGSVNNPTPSVAAISLKVGTPANPGVAPAVTPGYLKVAEITVGSAVAVITNADIADSRVVLQEAGIPARVTQNENDIAVLQNPPVQEIFIPAGACTYARGGGGNALFNPGAWFSASPAAHFNISVPVSGFLRAGDRILTLNAHLKDVVGTTLIARLFEQVQPTTTMTQVSTGVLSANTGVAQILPITGISFNAATNILEALKSYEVKIDRPAAPLFMHFYGLHVTFDHP